MVPGFDAGAGRSGHDAVYQQYFHRGDSRRRAAGALSQNYGHASVYWVIAAISLLTLFLTSKVKDI